MPRQTAVGRLSIIFIVALCVAACFAYFSALTPGYAATGVPRQFSYQGRLYDSSGNALGGSGTAYCFKYSIWDNSDTASGTKLWPAGSPTGESISVRYGVFNFNVGSGTDALTYNFADNSAVYLQVEAATKVGGSCTNGDESYETLGSVSGGRQQVVSSGFAINAGNALGVVTPNNASGASDSISVQSGTGTTSTGTLTLVTGNASGGTAGNVTINVGTSTASNGSILIGTSARTQTITIGNSTGGTITVGATSGSDLVLQDAQWGVTGAGVGTFVTGTIIATQTHSTNAIADSGALTINSGGTSAITVRSNNNGSGASGAAIFSSGTGSSTTGAVTLSSGNAAGGAAGNISIDVGTSSAGNGSILIGTAARAQTITVGNSTGGTITLGASSNSDLVLQDAQWSVTGAGVANFVTASVIGSQTFTTNNIADSGALTISTGGTGALVARTNNNGSGASGAATFASGTGSSTTGQVNINSGNAAGGAAGNIVVDVGTSSAGNGSILIGTAARAQTITIGNSTGGTITVGASSGSDLALQDAQWSVTGAGAATFASVTTVTHTGSGATTFSSGGGLGMTLDSASGDISVAANDGITFAATTLGNNGSTNVTINAGSTGTTATLLVKLDTSGTVVTTDTSTLNNGVGVALDTKSSGQAVRVAQHGVVTATADNTVTAGDYVGVGTATAGRAKSLGTTYPSTAGLQVLGRALSGASAGSTFLLLLEGLDNNVAAGGACATCVNLSPNSADTFGADNDPGIFLNENGVSTTAKLLELQQGGTDRFVVANNGGTTITGSDSSIVKETTTDFALGTVGSSLSNTNGQIEMSDGTVPTSGQGTISTTSINFTVSSGGAGAGSVTINRPDGKYIVILGGNAVTATCATAGTGINLYDSVAGTTANFTGTGTQCMNTSAVGAGAQAIARPNGTYRVFHGAAGTVSTLIDPTGTVAPGASVVLTAAAAAGTTTFKRPDGRYLITIGSSATGVTNIYDPIADTAPVAGPSAASTTWAAGAVALNRLDGQALIIAGGSTSNTQLYNPNSGAANIGAFTAGPTIDGNKAAGTCGINGTASVAFRRQDGKFVILSKASVAAIYDPVANTFNCYTSVTNVSAIGAGGHAIPLQNGKFLIFAGGGTTAFVYNQDFGTEPGTFSAYTGTAPSAIGAGAHSLMRHDGLWQIVTGGNTVTTNNLTTGLPMSDAFPSILTAGTPSATGSCTAGSHSYYTTFTTASVESELSNKSNIVWCTAGNGTVALTAIPVGPSGTTNRKVYRTITGDTGTPKLLTTISDNTTTTFNDTVADGSLGATYSVTAATTWYTSEDISNTALNGNSTLRWAIQTESVYAGTRNGAVNTAFIAVEFFIKTAVNSGGCATPLANATWVEIRNPGDLIHAVSGASCVKIGVHFNRPMPKRLIDERGTWTGEGSPVHRLDYPTPTLFSYQIENSVIMRRTNFDFSQPGSGNDQNGTVPAQLTAGAPTSGGLCTAGTHSWQTTFVTNGAESQLGPKSAVQTCGANATVPLSVIPTGPSGTTARKIYRTPAGDTAEPLLLTTISDNSTTTFSDTVADTSLGVAYTNGETSGPTGTRAETSRVEALSGHLVLPYGRLLPTTQVTTGGVGTGFYMGVMSAAHPVLPVATTEGSLVIQRDDRQFVIFSAAAANATLYDPLTQTMTAQSGAGNIPTATIAAGSLAIKRPDGKFLIVVGGATTTNIYDPNGPPGSRFTLGPALTAAAGLGSMAILNADGTYTIVHGGNVTTTSIYNPVRGTIIAGPTTTTAVACGSWAIPMAQPHNNQHKVFVGVLNGATTGVTTTMNYDANAKVFTAGLALSQAAGCGSSAFQRQDGYWVIINAGSGASGAAATTTTILNPYSGVTGNGPALTVAADQGAFAIPRADGTFLIAHGNAALTTTVYFPWGGVPAADGEMIGTTGVGPAIGAIAQGSVAFQRPDGKFVIITGSATTSNVTNIYDAGWFADGQYLSEQVNVPALSANSTIDWNKTPDDFVRVEVRAASSQAALATTGYTSVGSPGGSINNAGSETWVQVEVNMRRFFPPYCGPMNNVWVSSGGGGTAYCFRQISLPTLNSFQITNGQDLLTLQTNGLNVMRVTSNGNVYSSSNGGFYSGGADLAERYTSADALEPGEVVIGDPTSDHGVKRSMGQYQNNLLGVVSTAPGFVAGAFTEDSYPIALVGRVPVKVSTENGIIHAGDPVTAASIPGYAMKATQAGRVLGRILEEPDQKSFTACPAEAAGNSKIVKCGTVMLFVNLVDYQGQPVELAMAERNAAGDIIDSETGLAVAGDNQAGALSSTTSAIKTSVAVDKEHEILDFLKKLKDDQAKTLANGPMSEIFTGRLSASSEVITPKVVAALLSTEDLKAASIEGFTITSLGSLQADGALTVGGLATFKGEAIFEKLVSFLRTVVFKDQVNFEKTVSFNKDMAGFAVIKKDASRVDIAFDQEYGTLPIVTAALSFEPIKLRDDTIEDSTIKEKRIIKEGYQVFVSNHTTKGFTIVLNKPATEDLTLSWVAIAITDAKTSISQPLPIEVLPPSKDTAPTSPPVNSDTVPEGVTPVSEDLTQPPETLPADQAILQ